MNLTHLVMFSFLNGASAAAVSVPEVPGMEWRADAPRLHWRSDAPRLHWQDTETQ